MASQGYTVSPVMSPGVAGEELVLDFAISENRHGQNTDINDFSIDQSHDAVINNYRDIELDDGGDGRLPDYDYRMAIHETYPLFDSALQWAANGGVSEEFRDEFDAVMHGDDVAAVYPAIEGLISQFQESGKAPAPRSTPQPQQQQGGESMYQHMFGDMFDGADEELAGEYEEQARQMQSEGNNIGAFMSAGLAAYHDGEVSGQDVVQAVINQFGMEAASEFFTEITGR